MLVPLADIKTYLGITNNSHDVFLTQQGEIVSDAVEEYCNRKFLASNYVQTFYYEDMYEAGAKVDSIPLFQYPLNSVAQILERTDESDLVGLAVTDYRFHAPSAKVTKNQSGKFFSYGKILEVSYNSGFATVPNLIKEVVCSIVQERYNKHVSGIALDFGSDVQRVSIPGAISIDFDYSLENNQRKSHLGSIIGNKANILDTFRSERAVIGSIKLDYVS